MTDPNDEILTLEEVAAYLKSRQANCLPARPTRRYSSLQARREMALSS